MEARPERLNTLEIRSAEQEKAIEELSAQVAAQWAAIEKLQARLETLVKRFLELEEQSQPDVAATRPPHW